uniref:Regulatory protein zeste n=1 Tax=Daphnia galeata TaxID=27404 RepID=A0A8J2W7D4_9CRUS|nr:unnamed protein product [Daphnia galeata]
MAPALKEKAWSSLQIETLVDEYIARKGVILGALKPGITKEHKKRAWTEIVEALEQACPDEPIHDVKDTKKKFGNIKAIANAKIAEYKRSLTETGGGPEVILKPLHLKMLNELYGKTNAALAGNSITGGVQSETAINNPTQELRRSNNEKDAPSIHDSEPLPSCSNEEQLEIASDIEPDDPELQMAMVILNRKSSKQFGDEEDDYEGNLVSSRSQSSAEFGLTSHSPSLPKRPSTSLGITTVSLLSKKPKENSPTCSLRETVNRSKRQLCEKSDLSSSKRLLRDRFDVLNSIMTARKIRDDPMRDDEIPKDLYDIMYGKTKDLI